MVVRSLDLGEAGRTMMVVLESGGAPTALMRLSSSDPEVDRLIMRAEVTADARSFEPSLRHGLHYVREEIARSITEALFAGQGFALVGERVQVLARRFGVEKWQYNFGEKTDADLVFERQGFRVVVESKWESRLTLSTFRNAELAGQFDAMTALQMSREVDRGILVTVTQNPEGLCLTDPADALRAEPHIPWLNIVLCD